MRGIVSGGVISHSCRVTGVVSYGVINHSSRVTGGVSCTAIIVTVVE